MEATYQIKSYRSRGRLCAAHPHSSFGRIVLFLIIILGFSFFTDHSYAQESDSPNQPENQLIADTESAGQLLGQLEEIKTIDVKERVDDDLIVSRINNILTASDWFGDLNITVEEGIVIINGTTVKREYRLWAETIASRTEGVVAVINKLVIVPDPIGSFSPVLSEGKRLLNKAHELLPTFVLSMIVLIVTLLFAKILIRFWMHVFQQRIDSTMMRRLMARVGALPVLLIGIYIILNITGLGTLAATVIGGTGLLGLIIGFAFRDIAENFLASILISIQRPFRLGDSIQVLDFTGVVQAVTTRGTIIMTLDGNHVQIPNTVIYKEAIINFTANPKLRMDFMVGIGYEASISATQEIIMKLLREHPAVLQTPEPWVLAEALASSTVNLRIYFWVNPNEHNPLKVKSAVIRIVKHELVRLGVPMPDDAREIIFPNGIQVSYAADASSRPATTPVAPPLANPAEGDAPTESSELISSNREECEVSTASEGQLTSDVPLIKEQAANNGLDAERDNLLR